MTNVKHAREHAKHYKPKKARFAKLAKKNPPPCKKTTIAALMCAAVLKGDSRFCGNDGLALAGIVRRQLGSLAGRRRGGV